MAFTEGIYDISNFEYQNDPAISRSALWKFKELPKKYWWEYLSGKHKKVIDTDALRIGELIHTIILEPHLYDERFLAVPPAKKNTKVGKAQHAINVANAAGRHMISAAEYMMARDMQESFNQNQFASKIIEDAQFEKSIFWKNPKTGIMCKARPDIIKDGIVADLKTCADASPRAFQRSAAKYGYFLQAGMIFEAMTSLGIPLKAFIFICIEKTLPYSIGIYKLDSSALMKAVEQYQTLISKMKLCRDENYWPDYGVNTLLMPTWAEQGMDYES